MQDGDVWTKKSWVNSGEGRVELVGVVMKERRRRLKRGEARTDPPWSRLSPACLWQPACTPRRDTPKLNVSLEEFGVRPVRAPRDPCHCQKVGCFFYGGVLRFYNRMIKNKIECKTAYPPRTVPHM